MVRCSEGGRVTFWRVRRSAAATPVIVHGAKADPSSRNEWHLPDSEHTRSNRKGAVAVRQASVHLAYEVSSGIPQTYVNADASADVEDAAGFRHHLPGVGIDVPGDSSGSARGAAVPAGRNTLLDRGAGVVRLDGGAGRALADRAAVEVGAGAGGADLRDRLRAVVLGGAEGAVGHGGGNGGDDPGVHDAVGDRAAGHAEADGPADGGVADRDWRRRSAGEPVAEPGRSAD